LDYYSYFSTEDDLNEFGYSKSKYGHDAWAGLLVVREPKYFTEEVEDKNTVQLDVKHSDIVAYCVGDFNGIDSYEIATAWVDQRYKGMDIAVKVNVYFIFTCRMGGFNINLKYIRCI
jgi:hypothetical protein